MVDLIRAFYLLGQGLSLRGGFCLFRGHLLILCFGLCRVPRPLAIADTSGVTLADSVGVAVDEFDAVTDATDAVVV